MKAKKIVAVAMVTLGVALLAYSGMTFTNPEKPVEFLGLQYQTTAGDVLSPAAGLLAIIGGTAWFRARARRA